MPAFCSFDVAARLRAGRRPRCCQPADLRAVRRGTRSDSDIRDPALIEELLRTRVIIGVPELRRPRTCPLGHGIDTPDHGCKAGTRIGPTADEAIGEGAHLAGVLLCRSSSAMYRCTKSFGTMTVHVRPYQPSDVERCCEIINAAIAAMDGLNDAARAHVRASNVPDRLGRDLERWATLVVESDDRTVGLGALDHDEVKRVYIDPAAQGGGAATALMRSLEEMAAQRVGTIRLEASPSSVGFYESLGFVRVADDRLDIGEASFRFVRMTKDVDIDDEAGRS